MINPVGKVLSFLKEARAELGKVVWPPRRRAVRLTAIVVVVTILFGVFIGSVDYGLSKGVQAIITLTKPSQPAPIDQQSGGQPGNPVDIPAGQPQPNQPNQAPSK